MLILWTLLISASAAHKVFESTEDIGPEAFQNVTTLYPITRSTNNNSINKTTNIEKIVNENQIPDNDNNAVSNETETKEDKSKIDATIWKIDAAFANSNSDDDNEKENFTEDVTAKKNETKEFKPSPHLGSFFDEDNFRVTPTRPSVDSFTPVKTPSAGFLSSTKDDFRSSFTKIPKQMFQTHKQFPYKFESPILTKLKDPWRERPDSLDSRPTVEAPVRIPAGGFYKYEDPFKEKPRNHDAPFRDRPGKDDEDFGLGFTEGEKDSENAVKKRVNPWENFLRLVTAFLPVGLIISALTPTLITIDNTGPGVQGQPYPSNMFRRSDPGASELAAISERCRRRLLCELHSERNYQTPDNSSPRRGKLCHKIHCEDSEALARTLRWLLEYRRAAQNGQKIT